jgi:hypothetical protein
LRHNLLLGLTDRLGHPKRREHLKGVLMLMKYPATWQVFMERLDREFPQWGKMLMLPFSAAPLGFPFLLGWLGWGPRRLKPGLSHDAESGSLRPSRLDLGLQGGRSIVDPLAVFTTD